MKLSKILAFIVSVVVSAGIFASCKSATEQEKIDDPVNNEFTPGENEMPLQPIE